MAAEIVSDDRGRLFEMSRFNRFLRQWWGLLVWGGLGLALWLVPAGPLQRWTEELDHIAPLAAVFLLIYIARQLERIRETLEDRLPPDRFWSSLRKFLD
jgi:hypothetical protein